MTDTYVECMVKKQTKPILKFLKYFLITMTVLLGISFLMFGFLISLILAIAFGVGAYFSSKFTEVEFEYLYVDKQISVDKIYNQARRKKVATYDCEKMEVFAPIKSAKLDDYKNRQAKLSDYSSGVEKQPDTRYVMFYDGKEKLIFEPNEAFVKALYNIAPRKVFNY